MAPNNSKETTIRDAQRLATWYRRRLHADRHLNNVTVINYKQEIARLEALITHLTKAPK